MALERCGRRRQPSSRLGVLGQLVLVVAAAGSMAAAVPAMGDAPRARSGIASELASSPSADPASRARQACFHLLADGVGDYREMGEDEIALEYAAKHAADDWEAAYRGCRDGAVAWLDGHS